MTDALKLAVEVPGGEGFEPGKLQILVHRLGNTGRAIQHGCGDSFGRSFREPLDLPEPCRAVQRPDMRGVGVQLLFGRAFGQQIGTVNEPRER